MSAVDNLSDAEIASALADADLAPPAATEHLIDLLEARRRCDSATKKLREIAAARSLIERSYAAQREEIDAWRDQEFRRLDGESARLRLYMQPYVSALVEADPLGKKSVELVAGRAGYRTSPGKVVIEDSDALLAWLEESAPDLLRVKREPDLRAIKERIKEGERFPGVTITEGAEHFFAEPLISEPSR